MKKLLKSAAGRLAFGTLHPALLRDSAVITAFHRVEDQTTPDAITVSVRAFESFCDFARRYFDVVPLTELLARLNRGEEIAGRMAITFDDGYEDNHSTAAPILQARDLPATFFVATDLIGTDYQPYWDRENGVQTRWMSWEQVRALHAAGFEIGAHTRTHADLASLSEEAAAEEIDGSRRALEQALGAEIRLFSYPFGGPEQCTPAVRRLVEEMSFLCCLSCHGGLVRPGDDPFHLHRVPVNGWYADCWHWGVELLNDSRLGA